MALFGKKKSDASAVSNDDDGMKQFLELKNNLHDTISSVDDAHDDNVKKHGSNQKLSEEWETRVMEVDAIETDDPRAKKALSILRREAVARQQHHHSLAKTHKENAELLSEQLKDLNQTMVKMSDYQREFELTKRLKSISTFDTLSASAPSLGIDLKEISRLVHTANALVELKEGK